MSIKIPSFLISLKKAQIALWLACLLPMTGVANSSTPNQASPSLTTQNPINQATITQKAELTATGQSDLVDSLGLPESVRLALADANLGVDTLGVMISPLDGSTPILSHHQNTPFTPASTQKLITTAAALDTLGADFVWLTSVSYRGILSGGVLYGDLIIKGGGDPAISHEKLALLLYKISEKIKHIKGDIIIDNRLFENVRYDSNAFDGQGDRPYNAYPSAFLVNFGTIELKFMPSGSYQGERFVPSDGRVAVSLYPNLDLAYPKIISSANNCTTPTVKRRDDKLAIAGEFGVACGIRSTWLNFGDNELLAQNALKTGWQSFDKTFQGQVRFATDNESSPKTPLLVQASDPLSKQIWRINQFSNNVMTEQVALSLPIYAEHRQVSSYPLAFDFLNRWFGKINASAPTITRASGLCTDCKITPSAMSQLLATMYRHQDFDVFLQSLPVAGQTGTMQALARRNPTHPAIGRAWIKTGTLNDTSAMAGYVKADSGRWYTFVAIINDKGAGYSLDAVKVLDELLAWTAKQQSASTLTLD